MAGQQAGQQHQPEADRPQLVFTAPQPRAPLQGCSALLCFRYRALLSGFNKVLRLVHTKIQPSITSTLVSVTLNKGIYSRDL